MVRNVICVILFLMAMNFLHPKEYFAQEEKGLIGCWLFDEGKGEVAKDFSGNNNDGYIHGATWVDGKFGSALEFDGINDYVDCGKGPSLTFTDTLTIEVWIFTKAYTGRGKIVSKFDRLSNDWNGFALDQVGLSLGVQAYNMSNGIDGESTILLFPGKWSHVVYVFIKGTVRAYINGESEEIRGFPDTIGACDSNLQIGRYYDGSLYFKGIIDEVKIYNRTLSPEEIKTHYNRGQAVIAEAPDRKQPEIPKEMQVKKEKNKVYELLVCQRGEGNPRNSEGDIVQLKDGNLLLAWSERYQTSGDYAPGRISGKISSDGGRTWGKKFTLVENDAKINVMSPSFLRLKSGGILLFYQKHESYSVGTIWMKRSQDDGKTWNEPVCISAQPGANITLHDRVTQLSTGRILVPVFWTPDIIATGEDNLELFCYFSDDYGKTWQRSKTVDFWKGDEPGVIELKDGNIMMIIRPAGGQGHPYKCYSLNGGLSWTRPTAMPMDSSGSPASIKRIPKTGDILFIWNNYKSARVPLTAAISKDEGKSWEHIKDIESDKNYTYAYTSITFVEDKVLLTYYQAPSGSVGEYSGDKEKNKWSLKLKILDVEWFYE